MLLSIYIEFTRIIILEISGAYLLFGLTCCAHDTREPHARKDPHALRKRGGEGRQAQRIQTAKSLRAFTESTSRSQKGSLGIL